MANETLASMSTDEVWRAIRLGEMSLDDFEEWRDSQCDEAYNAGSDAEHWRHVAMSTYGDENV